MSLCHFKISPVAAAGFFRHAAGILFLSTLVLHADQFDVLRLYWQSNSLIGNPSASTLNSWAVTANNYWSTLNTNAGRTYLWSDLPLGSGQPGVNTGSSHMDATFGRLEAMALAWAAPGSSLQGNAALASAITNSLDWMCANIYTTTLIEYDNWWDWEIGGMQNFNNAQVLVYPVLTVAQITNYTASVDHFNPGGSGSKYGWQTGANLTDHCKGMLIRGIIGKNSGKMANAQTNLSPVFPYVTTSDGFYRDGSFVFHTAHPYTGGYGLTLLADVGQLVNLLNGSTWQITDPNLTNVFNWVTQTYEPVCYHGEWMGMVCGRTIARGPAGNGGVPWMIPPVEQFAPSAISNSIESWASKLSMPPGQYQFASMDCVVAWRTNFCVGLRMSSSRIYNFESFSGENLHGWFTGDGMLYLYLGNPDTQFTSDYWPTIDAYHMPGTTEEEFTRPAPVNNSAYGENTTTGQPWVGGAQVANLYGAAGMSVAAYGTSLTAKKSWFMFDNEIVCLGAGITCGDGKGEVDTTVEDRRLGLSPTNKFTVNGVVNLPVMGWSSNLTTTTWCALDGTGGYYFPGGATNLRAGFVANTGAWTTIDVNDTVSPNSSTDDYLTLWFNHGVNPTNATYAYVILPNYTASGMVAYAASPDMVVLTNTPMVQAASKPSLGVVAANFWVDGMNSADLITVNKKSSVIVSQNNSQISVGVADPTQTNSSSITVTLNRAATAVLSADPGVAVVQLLPQIVLSVNVNGSAGKSYQAVFSPLTNTLVWDANPSGTSTHPQDGSGTWNSSNTNWWNGGADVAWNDANPITAVFGATGTAGVVNMAGAHTNTWLLFNPPTSGTYTLAGTDSLTITNGIVAATSANVNVPLNLPVSQTWTVAANQELSLGAAVTPATSAVLSLAGGGTVSLNGGNSQLPASATVGFAGNAILDLGGNSQTLANLSFGSLTTGTATVGNGNLTITGGNWNPQPNAADTAVTTEDLSELATLTYTNGSQLLFQGTLGANSTTKLAETNNFTVSALNIATGNLTAAAPNYTKSVLLGQINVINTVSIQLGGYHNCGSFLGFNPGLTSPTVTLRGQSGGVTSVTSITIGENNNGNFPPAVLDTTAGSIDAIVNNLVVVNDNSGGGGASSGTMSISNGTVNAGVIYVNNPYGAVTTASTATLNQNAGTVLVGNLGLNASTSTGFPTITATYSLGEGTATAGLLSANIIAIVSTATLSTSSRATLNFTNGTIENYDPALGQPGSAGAAVGSYATAQNLTISGLNGGGAVTNDYRTLNIVLAPTGAHNFNAESGYLITEQSTALISGSGGLTANGAGTLVLSGANTYIGGTTISGGTLEADNNRALGTGLLTLGGGALSNNVSSTLTNFVNLSSAATVGVGATQTLVLGGIITNTGALTKAGSGTLVLTNGNTYTGNTTISAGTLALRGAASLASPLISVANGACFDVSGLNSPFVLGVSQTLSNYAAATGMLSGNVNASAGTNSISYAGMPAFIITNGVLTLAAGTGFNINNTGSALNAGSYTIITNATTGSPGAVAGIAPTSVTVVGNGLASGTTASLQISNGALALVVVGGGPSLTIPTLTNSIGISGTNLTFSWAADHIGYRLLVQTNHLPAGVSSNTNDWGTVAGSTTTNQVTVPINDILLNEFYRLVYP